MGFGAHLKRTREAAGLSLGDVAGRLKTPVRVLIALEEDNWAALGARIFVLGHLRSYARLLGESVPEGVEAAMLPAAEPVKLVSHTHVPRYRRLAEQVGRRAIYTVLTVTLVAPVWMHTRPHLTSSLAPAESLELPMPAADAGARETIASTLGVVERSPLVASLASLPERREAQAPRLTINLIGDSWVEIFAPDGSLVERGLLVEGQSRSFDVQRVGRVILGNSAAVELIQAGRAVDLAPFSRANVARFALSSDGSLAPVAN